ncbi:MAG: heparinase II/III domain-containing protein [Glycocaulis sp.]
MCRHFILAGILLVAAGCTAPSQEPAPPSLQADIAFPAHPGDQPGAPALDPAALMISSNRAARERAMDRVFQPRGDLPEWEYALPLNWSADPFGDLNWQFQLHAWRMLNPLADQYARQHDQAYFDRAVDIARDWKAWHTDRSAPLSWQDMATGLRASMLAYLIREARAGRAAISDDGWGDLLQLARAHGEILTRPGFIPDDNHGIFAAHGLMALCQTIGEMPECASGQSLAVRRMEELFAGQFLEDGVHAEHSPDYHWFAMTVFERVASTGWYAQTRFDAGLARARAAAPFLLHADGHQPGLGDSERTLRESDHARLPATPDTCLDEDGDNCVLLRHFDQAGYVIARSVRGAREPHSLFFTCGWQSTIHKHPDELSFEWWAFDGLILADSGKYGYTPDDTRAFVLSRAAHNTVSFGGREPHQPDGGGPFPGACTSEPRQEDGAIILSGAYDPPGPAARHAREIYYRPGESLVVRDRVEHRGGFSQWFHFAPGIDVSQTGRAGELRADLGASRPSLGIHTDPACSTRLHHGSRQPMQGWMSTGYGEMTARYTLEVVCPAGVAGAEARFEVVR